MYIGLNEDVCLCMSVSKCVRVSSKGMWNGKEEKQKKRKRGNVEILLLFLQSLKTIFDHGLEMINHRVDTEPPHHDLSNVVSVCPTEVR